MASNHKLILAKAIVNILRPLIRVLIRNEVTHAELTELVRRTYVEVAYDAHSIPGQEITFSRVAVLTGLSRKEVVRLKGILDDEELLVKQAPNRAQRVVRGWLGDKEFLNAKKQPRELPVKGKQASFQTLVQRYSGDITYGAVLDELNLIGVTELTRDNTVKLVNRAYIPYKDELEKVRIMSVCVADLFETAVYNIENKDGDPHFQRQMVYNGVDDTLAAKFRGLSSTKATELFDSLSKVLSEGHAKSNSKKRPAGKRLGLGIYYFEDNKASESSAGSSAGNGPAESDEPKAGKG